jgi:hypothetical protein
VRMSKAPRMIITTRAERDLIAGHLLIRSA